MIDPVNIQTDDQGKPLAKGDYVLATKYSDGDPGDAWAVGFYLEPGPPSGSTPRYRVGRADGSILYGPNGFRRIRRGLRADVGDWLVKHADALERSPPGVVNLWTMLTPAAFQDDSENSSGGLAKDAEDRLRAGIRRAIESTTDPVCANHLRDLLEGRS